MEEGNRREAPTPATVPGHNPGTGTSGALLSAEELAAIRARCDFATFAHDAEPGWWGGDALTLIRQDIPALLATIDALAAELVKPPALLGGDEGLVFSLERPLSMLDTIRRLQATCASLAAERDQAIRQRNHARAVLAYRLNPPEWDRNTQTFQGGNPEPKPLALEDDDGWRP